MRDLHLYAGLALSPVVIVYAVSAILLNHAYLPWGGRRGVGETQRTAVTVREDANSLVMASHVRRQIGVEGEITYVSRDRAARLLTFPVEAPGRVTSVRVDLATGMATIERRETGVWDALIYLHKMPGPHNASIRGNWVMIRLWGWLADATVYLVLFLTASGVYLWTLLKADRTAGLLFLGGGILSFAALVSAVVA
ncbi:MAG: hypothetical protein NVS1B4_07230 [Gemmatimonadaceae bacterium]